MVYASHRRRKRGAEITRLFLRGFAVSTLRGLADLAPASLADLASAAGWSDTEVPIAVAIAMAESGGNPNIIGDQTIGGSYGLWQIYLPKHPEFQGWNLFDPMTNARAAYSVYQQQGWNAWTTYKNRRYLRWLPAQPAVAPAGGGSPADAAPLTIDSATGQVIPDTTPTPQPQISSGAALGIAAAAVGAYIVSEWL